MAHVLYMETAPSNADTLFPTLRLLPSHIEYIPRNTTSDKPPVLCLSPPRSCSTGSSSPDLSITGFLSPVLNPLHTPVPVGNVLVARTDVFLPLITTAFVPPDGLLIHESMLGSRHRPKRPCLLLLVLSTHESAAFIWLCDGCVLGVLLAARASLLLYRRV